MAGGEFIIPILILIFGADIKTAGTLSLLISLPVVAIGVAKHRITGHYCSRDVLTYFVVPMSIGSVIGAILGGWLSSAAPTNALKVVLAIILATSAIKLRHHGSEADETFSKLHSAGTSAMALHVSGLTDGIGSLLPSAVKAGANGVRTGRADTQWRVSTCNGSITTSNEKNRS